MLITGAAGFAGFHLVNAALAKGMKVYAATRKDSDLRHLSHLPIRFVYPEYENANSLREMFDAHGFSYVIHAAGATKANSQEAYNRVNAEITRKLASAASRSDFKPVRFIFISSLAALGPQAYDAPGPITESKKPVPVTQYGKSKLLAEQYLAEFGNLSKAILRPTAVYGPREKDLFIMLNTFAKGLEPYIGNRPQRFSFIYVKDLADAVFEAVDSNIDSSWNLSDGNEYDRYALAQYAKEILGVKTLKLHVPTGIISLLASGMEMFAGKNSTPTLNKDKLNELCAENWFCSIAKAREELGFNPQYNLKTGLQETLQWYRANNWIK